MLAGTPVRPKNRGSHLSPTRSQVMIMNATQRAALVFWGVLALLLLAPLSSYAAVTEEGAPNIMVRPFDGPKGKALQERVVKVLEEQGADLVPAGFEGPTALDRKSTRLNSS